MKRLVKTQKSNLPETFRNRILFRLPMLVAIVAGLFLCLYPLSFVQRLQDLVFDQYQRFNPRVYEAQNPVRIVDIDDASLKAFGQWPWSRRVVAHLTDGLREHGARVVAFDILFSEPDRLSPERLLQELPQDQSDVIKSALGDRLVSSDAVFAKALAAQPSVLAQVLTTNPENLPNPPKSGFSYAGDDPTRSALPFFGAMEPLASLRDSAAGVGAINMALEDDTILRRVPLLFKLPNGLTPSLDLEVLRVAQGAGSYLVRSSNASGVRAFGAASGINAIKVGDAIIATDAHGAVRPHFAGDQPERRISAKDILQNSENAEAVRDRIILVGTSASALNDVRATPLSGVVPGIDIHAEVLENIFAGTLLVRPDYAPALEALACLILGLAGGWLGRTFAPLTGALAALVLVISTGLLSYTLFRQHNLLLDALLPALTAIAAFAGSSLLKYWQVERQKRWVSAAFSRYVAPEFVQRLSSHPEQLKLGGETRELTIMFCDVRNFTPRAQNMNAEDVVRFLNMVHTPFSEIILRSGGTIDKFIGDGLMAFWNAPLDVADHAARAVRAAEDMVRAAADIDQKLAMEAQQKGVAHLPLRIGIGLNSGAVFVGNMGSSQRFDYSIIGDAVNIAARLEAATKDFALPLLMSQATAEQSGRDDLTRIGAITLKGRSSETAVYGVKSGN